MNDADRDKLFWIVQAVWDGTKEVDTACAAIGEMINDMTDDAFVHGQDSVQGAYHNLV